MSDALGVLFHRRLVPGLLWLLRSVTPARRHVVVYGYPPAEGNSVETVRALTDLYDGRVVWLDPPPRNFVEAVGISSNRVVRVRKMSLRGLVAYVLADAVFFTHGLYAEPRSVRRKPTVNVWHGEGMKRNPVFYPGRRAGGPAQDFLVGLTERYSSLTARHLSLPAERVLMSGLPRNDALFKPCDDDALRRLGIDCERPFVLWMPSFRQSSGAGKNDGWVDTDDLDADRALADGLATAVQEFERHGIQMVVKPHVLDQVARRVRGGVILDSDQLVAEGVELYALLGRAAGLISDVSSVVTDFLLLNRPIGYYFPDLESYLRVRGIWPDSALEHLAGQILKTRQDFALFAQEVSSGSGDGADIRKAAAEWMGLRYTETAARDLMALLRLQGGSTFSASIREG
jgi:hypothetical protein